MPRIIHFIGTSIKTLLGNLHLSDAMASVGFFFKAFARRQNKTCFTRRCTDKRRVFRIRTRNEQIINMYGNRSKCLKKYDQDEHQSACTVCKLVDFHSIYSFFFQNTYCHYLCLSIMITDINVLDTQKSVS